MARIFAGFFGPLALLTSLARGALHGGSADSTLLAAWCSLLVFSVLGYAIGWIAGSTIEQSMGSMVAAELSKQETKEKTQVAGEAS